MAQQPKKAHPRDHDATKPLSPQRQLFVAEYRKDFNGKRAAIDSGYSRRSAAAQASRLLTYVNVQQALRDAIAPALQKAHMTADELLYLMEHSARRNMKQFVDPTTGRIRPIHDLSDDDAQLIELSETVRKNVDPGDNKTDEVHRLKLESRKDAWEILARHLQIGTETTAHLIIDDQKIIEILNGSKRRALEAKQRRAAKGLPT